MVGAVAYWHPATPEHPMAAAACLFGTLGLALLMNSPVRYPSFKGQPGRKPQSHRMLVVLAVFIVATVAEPVGMFLVLSGGYAASPMLRGFRRVGRWVGNPVGSTSGEADRQLRELRFQADSARAVREGTNSPKPES